MDASRARAESILADAHWKPHPEWGCFTKGSLVAGVQPDGRAMHIKDWARIPAGHPLHSADTPDEPHEAAEWLVRSFGNEGPCPHGAAEMPAPETDELWAPEEEAPDLGAELLEVQDEYDVTEGTISDDALAEALAEPPADQDHDAVAAEDASADVPPPERDPAVSPAYPGVAILPDDLSIALALVIEAVAAEEETRVAAVEALQAIDLQAMSDYGNWPAGVAMDANVEAGARRFMAFAQQRTAIQSHSLALRRSARDHRARGDLSALQAMSDGVAVGWP